MADRKKPDDESTNRETDEEMHPRGRETAVSNLSELDFEPGTVLCDQWKIRRLLRRGGYGVVFEAEEILLESTQAIKILDPDLRTRPKMLRRFRQEVNLMRSLAHHPNILQVYDYREDEDRQLALISMEYVEGGTVRDLLELARKKKQRISQGLGCRILLQALEALAGAHAAGVIHRDIAPGNILLAGGKPEDFLKDPQLDPKVKLLDFGIAGLVGDIRLSQEGEGLGTASYAAPEAVRGDAEITPAVDIYGLGAVVWELLTGHLPTVTSPRPSEVQRKIPRKLDHLLLQFLAAESKERPTSAEALERAREFVEMEVSGVRPFAAAITPDDEPHPLVHAARTILPHRIPAMALGIAVMIGLVWITDAPPTEEPQAMVRTELATDRDPVGLEAAPNHDASEPEDDGELAVTTEPKSLPSKPQEESRLRSKEPVQATEEPVLAAKEPEPESVPEEPPREAGVYLLSGAPAGTRLEAGLLEEVQILDGSLASDRPLTFAEDLAGACLTRAIEAGQPLDWGDLTTC